MIVRLLLSLICLQALFGADRVDWIVSARYVVTMDAEWRVVEDGAVAVRGDSIVAAGPRADIARDYRAARRLERPDALIAPGLVNTHTHAAMSLFRGLADDLRLQDWLEKYIFPAEVKFVTPEFVRWGTRLACLEMLLSGTTLFTDMYYFEEEVAEAAKEAGMRTVAGQTIIQFPVADAKTPEDGLARTERFLARYRGDPLVVPAVAPHGLYTNSDETLRASRALANRFDAPLLIHLSETRRENEETVAKRGVSPTRALDALGLFDGRTLAAHAVWADEDDLAIFRKRGVGVAHCPSSNMKLASGIAPVTRMLGLGIAVGLGPDGPAGSNNDFNLFEEMDLAAKLAKVSTGDPQALPARQALEIATIGGARALGLEKQLGSIEPGKKADLITVRLGEPHAVPMYDVYSQMVYALKGSDVSDVMVSGRLVVRDRRVLTLDRAAILRKAEDYRGRIQATLR